MKETQKAQKDDVTPVGHVWQCEVTCADLDLSRCLAVHSETVTGSAHVQKGTIQMDLFKAR